MIRAAGVLALVALAAVALVVHAGASGASSRSATPEATRLASGGPFDVPGAVPVSLLIRNDGDEGDRLLGGRTPAGEQVEVHRTRLVNGLRAMQTVPGGLAISPGEPIVLEPGGEHLMLVGLRIDLVQGETFPLTLLFERAGEVTVTARVRRRGDAAGLTPIPPVTAGALTIFYASAPPAPAGALEEDPD